ncbi:MAG: hypothetical protein V3V49_11745 [Candidatus Krumholzibacteria bacterium]
MKRISLILLTGAVCASLLFAAGCKNDRRLGPRFPDPSLDPNRVWVAIEPIQCLGNPWEQDWLKSNEDSYSAYPKDPTRQGLTPEEFEIIKDFYSRQGVVVFEGETRPKYDNVCLACSCPEGHTLYLWVRAGDVETMISFGYRVESPL